MESDFIVAVTFGLRNAPSAWFTWDGESGQFVTIANEDMATRLDFEEAQTLASDFNDYWATKGRDTRASVEPATPAQGLELI